ncbi:unnamed protein product, partial [Polarella glacialis]
VDKAQNIKTRRVVPEKICAFMQTKAPNTMLKLGQKPAGPDGKPAAAAGFQFRPGQKSKRKAAEDDNATLLRSIAERRDDPAEKARKEEESQLFDGIRNTLANWVQHCLASEEKQQKLLKVGTLSCRFSVPVSGWTPGLEEKTAAMVETYGGRLTQSKLTEQQ